MREYCIVVIRDETRWLRGGKKKVFNFKHDTASQRRFFFLLLLHSVRRAVSARLWK